MVFVSIFSDKTWSTKSSTFQETSDCHSTTLRNFSNHAFYSFLNDCGKYLFSAFSPLCVLPKNSCGRRATLTFESDFGISESCKLEFFRYSVTFPKIENFVFPVGEKVVSESRVFLGTQKKDKSLNLVSFAILGNLSGAPIYIIANNVTRSVKIGKIFMFWTTSRTNWLFFEHGTTDVSSDNSNRNRVKLLLKNYTILTEEIARRFYKKSSLRWDNCQRKCRFYILCGSEIGGHVRIFFVVVTAINCH